MEGESPPPHRGQIRPFFEAWKGADLDRDGFISREEFAQMPRIRELPEEKRGKLFSRLDKDGDSKLSQPELNRFGRPHDGQRGGPPMKRLWELDRDQSGGISFKEFNQGSMFEKLPSEKQEALFRRLDTDGDGVITPKDRPRTLSGGPEQRPHPKRPQNNRKEASEHSGGLNLQLDSNGDGTLSFEEFRRGPSVSGLTEDEQEERFEKLDRNQDLVLSRLDFGPPPQSAETDEEQP